MPDFKSSVIYQIYPRSFADSNGDGIGDLRGIITKLDYLADLGVDILWLSPIFQSPNADNGYDVSDYEAIMTEFGTMADFDELLAGVHERGMRLILDLVVNHSSDEHRWFVESRKSTDNPYRDYYIWRPPVPIAGDLSRPLLEQEPNDWQSIFSGPAWTLDEATGEYHLHLFLDKQPDLNWENPTLRNEVYNLMRFWLDKGVDGYRMDVIPFISKDQSFPNYPPGRFGDTSLYANGPRVHEFLQEMNRETLSRYNCVSIGEGIGISAGQANLYVGSDRGELNMIYHFDHAMPRDEHHFAKHAPEYTLLQLKAIFDKWDEALGDIGWQNIYFGNHDNPRVISRFGDPVNYHYESATMLATVLLTQRGTPTIYQGDEIGMTNCHFDAIDEFNDVQVLNAYKALVVPRKVSEGDFLESVNYIARDHARTPMQWFNTQNAGFTTGNPWLKVNPNYPQINAADQQVRDDSVISFYKKLLRWRKKAPAIWEGSYHDLLPDHPAVWAYERRLEETVLVILANFSANPVAVDVPVSGSVVLSNYPDTADTLRPFEARIYHA